jgi:hypothetical protein
MREFRNDFITLFFFLDSEIHIRIFKQVPALNNYVIYMYVTRVPVKCETKSKRNETN